MKKGAQKINLTEIEFCENYLSNGCDKNKAILDAGYASDPYFSQTATKMLEKPEVMSYVEQRKKELKEKSTITFEFNINKLKKIIELAVKDDAQEFYEIKQGVPAAISAITEANKMLGYYAAEKHVNTVVNINTDVDLKELKKLTDDLLITHQKEY